MFKEREQIPVIRNELLSDEQVAYNLAWHTKIGDQPKVLYNAMGPDISTVLLLTNPRLIIGVDEKGLLGQTQDYVEKYWYFIDRKPILRAGASGYLWGKTPENYRPTEDDWREFFSDLRDRRARGYWDIGSINRWDIDRLLMIELKKIGVRPESIAIKAKKYKYTEISFVWAYPGQRPVERQILYLNGRLNTVMKGDSGRSIKAVDCYYQKSLPNTDLTVPYLRLVSPAFSDRATVIVGYPLKSSESNEEYARNISLVLGEHFIPLKIARKYETKIDRIPYENETRDYGIRLNVFIRK